MKYSALLLIWSLFIVSILGLLLSSLLWTRRAKEIIVTVWVKTTIESEASDLRQIASQIFEDQIRLLLLNERGEPGKAKLLLWSIISAVLFLVGVILFETNIPSDSQFNSAIRIADSWSAVLFLMLLSVPGHWLLDYAFTKGFIKRYRETRVAGREAIFWRCVFSGGLSLIKVAASMIAVLAILSVFLYILGATGLITTEVHSEVVRMLKYPFLNGAVIGGVSLLGVAFGLIYFNLPAQILMAASLSVSLIVVVLMLLSIAVAKNRNTLKALAFATDRLDRVSPRVLLSTSLTLFAIATGLMQAYTFPTSIDSAPAQASPTIPAR